MKHIFTILSNRNAIMLLALFCGIVWGKYAVHIAFLSMPALAFMMVISLVFFDLKFIFKAEQAWKYFLSGVFLNYVLSGVILMLLAYAFIPNNNELLLGFMFIVLAPPGVVIVPFATLFKGNVDYAATGVLGGYLLLLVIFPAFIYFIPIDAGSNLVSETVKILLVIVIMPLLLSRLLRHRGVLPTIQKFRAPLINWSFFVIIYIVIGLNNDIFRGDIMLLLKPTLVLIIFLFVFAILFDYILKRLRYPRSLRMSQTLMFAVKNNGFSAVVSLNLIGAQAAIPSAALSIVLLFYLIVFPFFYRGKD